MSCYITVTFFHCCVIGPPSMCIAGQRGPGQRAWLDNLKRSTLQWLKIIKVLKEDMVRKNKYYIFWVRRGCRICRWLVKESYKRKKGNSILTFGYGQQPYWPDANRQHVCPSAQDPPPGHGTSWSLYCCCFGSETVAKRFVSIGLVSLVESLDALLIWNVTLVTFGTTTGFIAATHCLQSQTESIVKKIIYRRRVRVTVFSGKDQCSKKVCIRMQNAMPQRTMQQKTIH